MLVLLNRVVPSIMDIFNASVTELKQRMGQLNEELLTDLTPQKQHELAVIRAAIHQRSGTQLKKLARNFFIVFVVLLLMLLLAHLYPPQHAL